MPYSCLEWVNETICFFQILNKKNKSRHLKFHNELHEEYHDQESLREEEENVMEVEENVAEISPMVRLLNIFFYIVNGAS